MPKTLQNMHMFKIAAFRVAAAFSLRVSVRLRNPEEEEEEEKEKRS